MSRQAAVYNQSLQEALKFAPSSFQRWSFRPVVVGDAPKFPKPLLGRDAIRRRTSKEGAAMSSDELRGLADELRALASSLEAQVEQPTLEMQIGYKLLDGAISIPQCLKSWDVKGKGEVIKTAMRQNLRNMNFSATAVEVDALFDSWDADKGNTLPDESVIASSDQVAVRLLARAPDECPKPVPHTTVPLITARSMITVSFQAARLTLRSSTLVSAWRNRRRSRRGTHPTHRGSRLRRYGQRRRKRRKRPLSLIGPQCLRKSSRSWSPA